MFLSTKRLSDCVSVLYTTLIPSQNHSGWLILRTLKSRPPHRPTERIVPYYKLYTVTGPLGDPTVILKRCSPDGAICMAVIWTISGVTEIH